MNNCQYLSNGYIMVDKDSIDKVYSIIQYLPLEMQMKIIFGWLASEGNRSELIYDQFDIDESLRVYVDLVKEILTQDVPDYDYDNIIEQIEELRKEKEENANS